MAYGKQHPGPQTPTVRVKVVGSTVVLSKLHTTLTDTRYTELLARFGGQASLTQQ